MNKSRDYLNRLTLEQRIEIAKRMTSNPKKIHGIQQYLYQIGRGDRTPSRSVTAQIQRATKGKVRPSDFDKEAIENSKCNGTIQ